jgi:redox-sensitive bicupin YhaK (pirin superfamily)
VSDLEPRPSPHLLGGLGPVAPRPVLDLLPGKTVTLGERMQVRRLLPTLGRRMVGPWAFVDHYGPDDIAGGDGMQVIPHPHTGLQTVSWLIEGRVHHKDSLGSDVSFGPGELALMTAGHGISHSEQSPVPHPRLLQGAQLWVALPDASRDTAPAFEHHAVLPGFEVDGVRATVLMGSLAGATSPGTAWSPMVGVDLALEAGADVEVPLEPGFEHAVLASSGSSVVEGAPVEHGSMLYLGTGRRTLRVSASAPSRLLLLGGEPFEEQIVMWWNFVGREGDEVAGFREQWEAGERFGHVEGFEDRERTPAPPMPPVPLKPRGRER